jgi:hypothetical protein
MPGIYCEAVIADRKATECRLHAATMLSDSLPTDLPCGRCSAAQLEHPGQRVECHLTGLVFGPALADDPRYLGNRDENPTVVAFICLG